MDREEVNYTENSVDIDENKRSNIRALRHLITLIRKDVAHHEEVIKINEEYLGRLEAVLSGMVNDKVKPCKDERIQSLWLGRKLENILIKNYILLWKDLEDRTAEDLLRLDEVYSWNIDSIKIQLEKHGRKLKDSVDE